uniref:Protein-tyrosine phosphatase n=1 Tax=Haemonchus contortus TaxID=6289 RepID=A0A7I4YKG6_HAECO|nr:Protein-tyrosine phosphatase domain containing protein [Haemonchus contortus]
MVKKSGVVVQPSNRKRNKDQKEPNKNDQPQQQQPRQSRGSEVVAKWVMRALNTGVDNLRAEYRSLARYTLPDATYEAFKANHEAGRNRYQDVPCQDQYRVVITWPGAPVDYIHANYVGTPLSDKRFICTQGPLDGTITEFWMMVLQEESQTIIMLCNCIETGKYKCAEYWPNQMGTSKTFAGIEIFNVQMRPMSPEEQSVIVSVLIVKFTKPDGTHEQREVRHYQWIDWPDRGVPPCRLTSMELLSRVRGTTKPIIVHCSAGIGRTGTVVAIEYILERMQAGVECAAMNDLLKELRNQRAYTIQNDLQYLFIHRVMLCYFLEKHKQRYESLLTEEVQAKYKKFVEDYNLATGTS